MSRAYFAKEMRDGENTIDHGGPQYQKELDRELKFAERKKCDEKSDIRDMGVKQDDCFTPSGRKVVDRIIRSSEKPKVSTDVNLHADTTEPGENTITSNSYEKKMSPSAEKVQDRLMGSASPTARKIQKYEVFNS